MTRTLWLINAAVAVLVAVANPVANAVDDPRCVIDPIRLGCDVGGGGPGDETPWEMVKEWGQFNGVSDCVSGGVSGELLTRFLRWADGPNAGDLVNQTDFGGWPGSEVPFAPPRWDGSPATFGPDGLVRDVVCLTPGFEFFEEIWELLPSGELSVDPRERGLVGLETWFWWEGATIIGPISMIWTHPGLGLTFEVEATAHAESFDWAIDGFETTTSSAGSDEDLPASAAVLYTFEQRAQSSLSVDVVWTGQHRVRLVGDVWGPWLPIPGTGVRSDFLVYEVIEVRSGLVGD